MKMSVEAWEGKIGSEIGGRLEDREEILGKMRKDFKKIRQLGLRISLRGYKYPKNVLLRRG